MPRLSIGTPLSVSDSKAPATDLWAVSTPPGMKRRKLPRRERDARDELAAVKAASAEEGIMGQSCMVRWVSVWRERERECISGGPICEHEQRAREERRGKAPRDPREVLTDADVRVKDWRAGREGEEAEREERSGSVRCQREREVREEQSEREEICTGRPSRR
ncbi:unnamed protein product [Closterium sp. NIES-53]